MIVGLLAALIFGGILYAALAAAGVLRQSPRFAAILMGGYGLRLILQAFIRDIPFFTHSAGELMGDAAAYEYFAVMIAERWQRFGFTYVTSEEGLPLGPTSLPSNAFAVLIYLNGGAATRLGCTALVALAAGLAALNVYKLAVEFGAEVRNVTLVASMFYLAPSFLFYSSDTFKDALVVCIAMGALGSALRLSRKISLVHIVIGLLCLWGLWYVRFYLIFVTIAPLVVGIAGIGSKSVARSVMASLVLAIGLVCLGAFTDILQVASDKASQTFNVATSERVLDVNAAGGSGVDFDDNGHPYAALPAKLAYTLFSPFIWASGSIGFHLGKLDVLVWYFLLYRAARFVRTGNLQIVLLMATFAVPCTLMYAMTMANVGLVVRQRLIIVAATAVLAALYKPPPVPIRAPARRPRTRAPARRAEAVTARRTQTDG